MQCTSLQTQKAFAKLLEQITSCATNSKRQHLHVVAHASLIV